MNRMIRLFCCLPVFLSACIRSPRPPGPPVSPTVPLSSTLTPAPTPKQLRSSPAPTLAAGASWRVFRVADGLPGDSATAVSLSPDGAVWVGTSRGAARFDGHSWTSFSTHEGLLSNLVLSLAVDPRGVVWFGTDKGISRYDRQGWVSYSVQDGFPTGYVQVAAAGRSGQVWFGITGAGADWAFGNGAVRLDDAGTLTKGDDEVEVYAPTRQRMAGDLVSAILDMGQAGMLFGLTPEGTVRSNSGRGGLLRLLGAHTPGRQDDRWFRIQSADGLPAGAVSALALAPDGSLWVGTPAGLLHAQVNPGPALNFEVFRLFTRADGLPSNRVLSLAITGSGDLWVGTDAGLAHISYGDLIRSMTVGLPARQVRSIAVAPSGELWIATPQGVGLWSPAR